MFCSICNWVHSSLLNFDVKRRSRSEMILQGIPKCRNMCVVYRVVIPSESMSLLLGRNIAALVLLRFLFLFPYIQCPLQGLNSSTTHVRTGKFPYHGKAPSGLSHSFYIRHVGASLLDLPHFLIIPTLRYSLIRLPGSVPMAYL